MKWQTWDDGAQVTFKHGARLSVWQKPKKLWRWHWLVEFPGDDGKFGPGGRAVRGEAASMGDAKRAAEAAWEEESDDS